MGGRSVASGCSSGDAAAPPHALARAGDARRQLEFRAFDFVLCELHFDGSEMTGQDLLDELRREQLLPFSTVFVMVTGEATYAKVAEAAESALDGYLLKPHKATHLAERLQVARIRKLSLQDIFDAIDAQEFERAANLCMERFESKGIAFHERLRDGFLDIAKRNAARCVVIDANRSIWIDEWTQLVLG